jgi:tRNA A-37 threonylcarbamoyl transferase component Bud32
VTSGRYTVERVLGRGGTAVVELARDGAGRPVAVKRVALHGSAHDIALARRRIRREAELLGSVRHPAVLPLLAVEDDGTDVLLVTPYAPGGTLHDRIAAGGPLPATEVARLAGPLLDGLAAVHRLGIVHRDVTPANILFLPSGSPVLADFGVARGRDHTSGLTADGSRVGTPGFMAPEQARGEAATAATDVFGLAASLVFALTGAGPYGTGSPELLAWRASRGDRAPLPPGLPAAMAADLDAMLRTDPSTRPTAAAIRRGPAGTLPTAPTPVPDPGAGAQGRGASRRVVAVALASAVAVAAVVVGLARAGHDPATSPEGGPRTVAAVPCTLLPYQPCGQPVAPFTDGHGCVLGHADYDGNAANGCEAAPDTVDGATLTPAQPIVANLVPADDVDRYRLHLTDRLQLLCDGSAAVRLTAPPGVTDRVDVLRDGVVVASALSANGRAATATVGDPSCLRDDSGWYEVRVDSEVGRSSTPYRLETAGHL